MLCLSRKTDETVVIDVGGVKVTVLVVRIGRDKVRLAFDAPKESVTIHRGEIWNRIQRGVPQKTAGRPQQDNGEAVATDATQATSARPQGAPGGQASDGPQHGCAVGGTEAPSSDGEKSGVGVEDLWATRRSYLKRMEKK